MEVACSKCSDILVQHDSLCFACSSLIRDKYKDRIEELEKENEALREILNERGEKMCGTCHGWFAPFKPKYPEHRTSVSWQGVRGWMCRNCSKLRAMEKKNELS